MYHPCIGTPLIHPYYFCTRNQSRFRVLLLYGRFQTRLFRSVEPLRVYIAKLDQFQFSLTFKPNPIWGIQKCYREYPYGTNYNEYTPRRRAWQVRQIRPNLLQDSQVRQRYFRCPSQAPRHQRTAHSGAASRTGHIYYCRGKGQDRTG